MQRVAPILLLLILGVVALVVFLPSDDDTTALDTQTDSSAADASDERQPAPSVRGEGDAPTRSAVSSETAVLVRALDAQGQPHSDAEFFLAHEGRDPVVVSTTDGSTLIEPPEISLRIAVRADNKWSALQSYTRQSLGESQEIVLRTETPAGVIEVLASHADDRPLALFETSIEWAMDDQGVGEQSLAWLYRNAIARHDGRTGRALIEGVPPGTYSLKVETENEVTKTASVKLASLATETVRLKLQPGAFFLGRVLFADGSPAPNATVYLRGSEISMIDEAGLPQEWMVARVSDGQKARTGADGTFTVGPAAADDYRIGVIHPDNPGMKLSDDYTVGPGQSLDIGDLVLPQSRRLKVVVTRAADGQPVAGATVKYQSRESADSMFGAFVDLKGDSAETTDENGEVQITGLGPGEWIVSAQVEGLAPKEAEVTIEPDDLVRVVPVALDPELRVTGQIVDRIAGQPIQGAAVAAVPSNDDASLWEDFIPTDALVRNAPKGETDADGRFDIGGLGAGDWRLGVSAEGYAKALDGPFPVNYELPTPNRTIALMTGGTVLVRVFDDKGDPQPKTTVQLYTFGGADGRVESTDDNGEALFENLSSGEFMVSATNISVEQQFSASNMEQLGGFSQEIRSFELKESESVTITLGGLVERANIEGFVMKAGEPVDGMQVILYSPSFNKFLTTEEDGYYLVEAVPNGDYMMMIGNFQMGGGTGWTGSVSVKGTSTVRKDVDLPGAGVVVVVKDSSTGEPIGQVPVILRKRDASFGGGNVRTNAKGEAEFLYLGPGNYSVSAGFAAMPFFGGGKEYATKFVESVNVPPNSDAVHRVEVTLEPAATLKGTVVDLRGDPLQGVGVFYLDNSGQPVTQFDFAGTKKDGSFEVTSLPSGRGRILARHKEFGQIETEVVLTAGDTANIDLTLDTGTLVHLFVTDGSKDPLAGIQATLIDERGSPISAMYTGMTGWMDAIAFIGGGEQVLGPVPAGSYTVRLMPIGGIPVDHTLEIPPGTPDMHLSLEYDPE